MAEGRVSEGAASPAVSIGFCILSHNDSGQLLDLVHALNRIYGAPPIACHHDVSQSPLDPGLFPANVVFTAETVRTGWGRLSVVEAGLLAMATLRRAADPDWTVLLSAADYPIAPAERLYALLADTEVDAFVDVRPLWMSGKPTAKLVGTNNAALDHFVSDGNIRIKSRFYLSPELWFPLVRFSPKLRLGRFTWRAPVVMPSVRRSGVSIYYGDHWFMANRRAIGALVSPGRARDFLLRHLKWRPQADECFYQTVLMNEPGLTICADNKRFAEWNGGGAHPMALTPNEVPRMLASGDMFARKFARDAPALRAIDRALADEGAA